MPGSYEAREEKAQSLDYTAAGAVRAYDKSVATYHLSVTWEDLSTADKANIVAFFHNDTGDSPAGVNGVVNTFTLTDHNAATYTACFAEPELKFEEMLAPLWKLTVELITTTLLAT